MLGTARKKVSRVQEAVSQAQQAPAEAQQSHAKRVAEVVEAEQRLITLQTGAASPVTTGSIMEPGVPDWAAELQVLNTQASSSRRGDDAATDEGIATSWAPQPQVCQHPHCQFRWCPTQSSDEASLDVRLSGRQCWGSYTPRPSSQASHNRPR